MQCHLHVKRSFPDPTSHIPGTGIHLHRDHDLWIPHDAINRPRQELNLGGVQASERETAIGQEVDVFARGERTDLHRIEQDGAVTGKLVYAGRRPTEDLPVHSATATEMRPHARRAQLVRQVVVQLFANTAQSVRHGLDLLQPAISN